MWQTLSPTKITGENYFKQIFQVFKIVLSIFTANRKVRILENLLNLNNNSQTVEFDPQCTPSSPRSLVWKLLQALYTGWVWTRRQGFSFFPAPNLGLWYHPRGVRCQHILSRLRFSSLNQLLGWKLSTPCLHVSRECWVRIVLTPVSAHRMGCH